MLQSSKLFFSKRSSSVITNVSIPVPWGEIAGKKYERLSPVCSSPNKSSKSINKSLPFLCFHGWLDNANSFNKLIPKIQKRHPDLEFISFDWPGHGLSSKRPDGTYNNITVYISDIYRILQHLNLNDTGFNSIGHSMGGNALVQFNCIFPNLNKNMIRLESDGFVTYKPDQLRDHMVRSIQQQVKFDNLLLNSSSKTDNKYTYEQAKARLSKGSSWHGQYIPASVVNDSVDILLERGLKKLSNEFCPETNQQLYNFARDIKVILPSIPAFSLADATELIKTGYNECKHNELLIQATDNIWAQIGVKRNPDLWNIWGQNMPYLLYSQNENFQMCCVEGNHHVHLNDPDVMTEKICDWIEDPGDRTGSIDDLELRERRIPEEFRP